MMTPLGGQGGAHVRSTLLEVMLEAVKLRGAEPGTRGRPDMPEPEEKSRNDPQTTPRRREEERYMVSNISLSLSLTTAELELHVHWL
jgi:hypothetical protein